MNQSPATPQRIWLHTSCFRVSPPAKPASRPVMPENAGYFCCKLQAGNNGGKPLLPAREIMLYYTFLVIDSQIDKRRRGVVPASRPITSEKMGITPCAPEAPGWPYLPAGIRINTHPATVFPQRKRRRGTNASLTQCANRFGLYHIPGIAILGLMRTFMFVGDRRGKIDDLLPEGSRPARCQRCRAYDAHSPRQPNQ